MSFFSNAVKLISRKKKNTKEEICESNDFSEQSQEFDFSLRNYAKESFSVLIVRPLSGYVPKIIRITSLIIIGGMVGVIAALIFFGIFLQFGSVENTFISSLVQSRFEKLLPDSDLSMKSAMLRWNADVGAIEILMNRVRLDDLSMPQVSILPDYEESFRQQRLVAKAISLVNPKIHLDIGDDFKNISLNPNFEKGGENRALLEPLTTFSNLNNLLDDNLIVKFINANVSIVENGVSWKFKNVYCEHKIGDKFPRALDCSIFFPRHEYASSIYLTRLDGDAKNRSIYTVKIDSLNPSSINSAFAKRNTPIDGRVFSIIDGYNLPVSGTLKLNFEGTKFLGGKFDLIGATGSIKLPIENTLSLSLGKKIDNGSVSGSFSENGAKIDSINVSYGNSGLQLTGIDVPMNEFKFLDVINIDGTLSLTNIDIQEMESILPKSLSESAVDALKNYLSEFKLELFKFDLKGPIAFGNRVGREKLNIGQGVFRIKDAKIPLGEHLVTDVSATGTISDDGFDIRLTSAVFHDTLINNGVFFVSNKDGSWIGKINADVPINDIAAYANYVSPKLSSLPLEKMHMKGIANLDMKLVRVEGDNQLQQSDLPFRIVEGEGVLRSDNNTKELKLAWNDEKLSASGDMVTGKNKISLRVNENFASHSGNCEFLFISNSDFLNALIPNIRMCDGNYALKINSSWKDKLEEYDVNLNLKDATMILPMIGDIKSRKDDGRFTAHVVHDNKNFEFSQMMLKTPNSQISGKMTVDENGRLLKCSLDEFDINGSSAKINILKKDDCVLFSAVGDSLDVSKVFQASDYVDENMKISAYINLKEAIISNVHRIKNVKGNLDIKDGKIVGGACYSVIGDDTTLVITAKDIEGTNDTLLSLSASNAGEFLKYFKIMNTVHGGNINVVIKSSKDANQSLSGAFEVSDFIVQNNAHLLKLISLSSTSWVPNAENLMVGFNFCMGNFTIADKQIIIENGRAISPSIAISYGGSFDRMNDNFDITGISLPMSSVLNHQNSNGSLVARYRISGSLGMPAIVVNPLEFIGNGILNETFGNMLPIIMMPPEESINDSIVPPENSTDPFLQRAFDGKAAQEKKHKKLPLRRQNTDNKFGIKIIRGVGGNIIPFAKVARA
ncbi:MAG: hypothetical protein LBF54_03650 [Holosporaceae bacterium]|jgi:hypothetical protein|nr:hypothetical protein [Holosporaceae bacterium]